MSRSTKPHRRVVTRVAAVGLLWLAFVVAVPDSDAEQTMADGDVEAREISPALRRQPDPARAGFYGFGEVATPQVIAGWDIDIRPDGRGLPPGSGSVADGEELYDAQCAACHGTFGEGVGRWPVLTGGVGSLSDARPEKTVGSFWPYASTLWDYVHRTMPYFEPQSLSDGEVYAIVAYVLYLNDLVADDFVLTRENLPEIEMPNRDGFSIDPRPDVRNVACMEDCKDPATIRIIGASTEPDGAPSEPVGAPNLGPIDD